MAESAALNSRQISRVHNETTSHGNSPPRAISISLSRRAFQRKRTTIGIVSPRFYIFLELATICERKRIVNGERERRVYVPQLGSDFQFEGFYREAIVLALSFLLFRGAEGHRGKKRKS